MQGKDEHRLHTLGVVLMAAEMAEAEPIGLQADARWIEGMKGCAPALMLNADTAHALNGDLQGCAVGKWSGGVAVAVMEGQIEHVAAMAVVGKTFRSTCLRGPDLHRTIANSKRSSLVMVIEEINQRHQHRLAPPLLWIGSPGKAARRQESLGRRALCLGPMARLEWLQGSRHFR